MCRTSLTLIPSVVMYLHNKIEIPLITAAKFGFGASPDDVWKGNQRSFQWRAERVHAFFQTWQTNRGLVVGKGGHAWCELMFRHVRREEWSARRGWEMPLFSFFFREGSLSTAAPVVSSAVLPLFLWLAVQRSEKPQKVMEELLLGHWLWTSGVSG